MTDSSYVDHLRAGGTTTWSAWRGEHPDVEGLDFARTAESGSPFGATQLEVVRRLPKGPRFAELADRVLRTPAPGRGAIDIPLPGSSRAYGGPAVEPDDLPPAELIRLAASVLADLSQSSVERSRDQGSGGGFWSRAPAVDVHGAPLTARIVKRALARAGVRLGGRKAVPIVLAGPFEAMMLEFWSVQVQRGRAVRWERIWTRAEALDRLPGATALTDTAARLAAPQIVAAADPARAVELVMGIVGRRGGAVDVRPGVAVTEAHRWVNRTRPDATPTYPPGTDQALAAPGPQATWARQKAAQLRDGLAGYAVHGDLAVLTRESDDAPRTPDVAAALAVTLAAIEQTWKAAN